MSGKQTEEVWASPIPPRLRLAALALAALCDRAGHWSGPLSQICALTRQSDRTTQAALIELEEIGILHRDETAGKSTTYTLTPEEVAGVPPKELRGLSETPEEVAPLVLKSLPINGARKAFETQFAEFWTAYPRKVGKPKALAAYLTLQPDPPTHHKMLRDLLDRSRTAAWLQDGGAFIPHPTTYLNQRRFDDEPTDPRAPQRFLDGLPEN